MKIEEFEILEKKIKGLVEQIGILRRENQRLQLKVKELQGQGVRNRKVEEDIREKVSNLIQMIDSIQVDDEK